MICMYFRVISLVTLLLIQANLYILETTLSSEWQSVKQTFGKVWPRFYTCHFPCYPFSLVKVKTLPTSNCTALCSIHNKILPTAAEFLLAFFQKTSSKQRQQREILLTLHQWFHWSWLHLSKESSIGLVNKVLNVWEEDNPKNLRCNYPVLSYNDVGIYLNTSHMWIIHQIANYHIISIVPCLNTVPSVQGSFQQSHIQAAIPVFFLSYAHMRWCLYDHTVCLCVCLKSRALSAD